MKNDYSVAGVKISVPPTLLFSLVGRVDDVRACVSADFKQDGDLIYLLGLTRDELGGSELAAELNFAGGQVPQVDALANRARYLGIHAAMQRGLIRAAHDLSDGGLAVALAEMAIAGRLGACVNLDHVPCRPLDLAAHSLLSTPQPLRPGSRGSTWRAWARSPRSRCCGSLITRPSSWPVQWRSWLRPGRPH